MGLIWTQLPEEIKYTAKHIGLVVLVVPLTAAVIYLFTSWTPLPSGAIVLQASPSQL